MPEFITSISIPPGGRREYLPSRRACLRTIRARPVRRTLNHHCDSRSFRLVTHTPLTQQSVPIPIRTAALFRKGAHHFTSNQTLQSGPALPPPPCLRFQRCLVNKIPPSVEPGLDNASKGSPSSLVSAGTSAALYKETVVPKHRRSGIARREFPFSSSVVSTCVCTSLPPTHSATSRHSQF